MTHHPDLIGKPVTITRHPWAPPGPDEGIYLGDGERGFTLLIDGGGRWTYRHNEVARIDPHTEKGPAPAPAEASPKPYDVCHHAQPEENRNIRRKASLTHRTQHHRRKT